MNIMYKTIIGFFLSCIIIILFIQFNKLLTEVDTLNLEIEKLSCDKDIIEIPVTATYFFDYDPCSNKVRHNINWTSPSNFDIRMIEK